MEGRFWLLHLVCGVGLFVLLGVHMLWMHLGGLFSRLGFVITDPLSYQSVVLRANSAAWQTFYFLLLGFATFHGFYGLRGIILEVLSLEAGQTLLTAIMVVAGILVFLYGSYVILST